MIYDGDSSPIDLLVAKESNMRNHHLFVVTVLIPLAMVLYACGGETPATHSNVSVRTLQWPHKAR